MQESKQEEDYLKSKPLKQLYPDLEMRQKLVAQKLQSKGKNQIFVRCEPQPKYCSFPHSHCFNIIAPNTYDIAYLTATIHSRLNAKMQASSMQSLFIFCKGKIVTAFRDKIGTFWSAFKDQDGILYLQYADSAPF